MSSSFDLFLATNEWEEKDEDGVDYVRAKTLKPLFLPKIGEEAREIYKINSKANAQIRQAG